MENINTTTWRMLDQRPTGEAPPHGLDALWHRVIGLAGRFSLNRRRFMGQADRIIAMQNDYSHCSDRKLQGLIAPLHDRFRLGRNTAEDRDLALTIVREVAARTVGLRPFREQIAGALAIEAGCVAEMATGEGKTLVATLPAVIAGWRGRGCHVITANSYLAKRDAELMSAIYRFCGLTVGCLEPDMVPAARKRAYDAHITYCTNKDVAADFLRDRLLMGNLQGLPSMLLSRMVGGRGSAMDRLVQRGLACAIVDEADAVLIDDAITPLLISGESSNPDHIEAYTQAGTLCSKLDPATDYRVDRHYREVHLTKAGKRQLAEMAQPLGGIWAAARRREELVLQALIARAFFIRDKQYVIDDNKVVIVDETTGRIMPDRTWRNGLHQAIESKEGFEINLAKETHARISFQRFFRLYGKLSGMTGTASEAQAELWRVYRLPVIAVPTHRPSRRVVLPDRVFTSAAAKWEAVIEAIGSVHRTGRPILIGTRSIRESEYLSSRLAAMGVVHRLLNAVREKSEARIIAGAGREGQITVSTNMAGRGTDIQLGAGVAALGGLHVIATQRAEARRIDRQLFGRCARQGDPGSAQAFVSLEDKLIKKNSRLMASAFKQYYRSKNKEISSAFWRYAIDELQCRAERASLAMRRDVLSTDNWIDHQLGFAGG